MAKPKTDDRPDWMEEEDSRSAAKEPGVPTNEEAPRLQRVERQPERILVTFYLRPDIARAFDTLVFQEKYNSKKRRPVLIEEALFDLLGKYGADTSNL